LWIVKTKDGRTVTLRFLVGEDKQGIVEFFASMSAKALEWGNPPYTDEVVDRWISNLENMTALVAIYDKRIVGYATISKGTRERRKGVGDLVMYLLQDFQNAGLGAAMLSRLLNLAEKEGLHRIGLHVIADNKIAIHLYEKFGFAREGILKESYFGRDKRYHDELVMGLVLSNSRLNV
jgi:RimJ/RimL family protein N-acetyltransferase